MGWGADNRWIYEIMVNVNNEDVSKIMTGEKTVLIVKPVPRDHIVFYCNEKNVNGNYLKLFLYSKNYGVFAESNAYISTEGVSFIPHAHHSYKNNPSEYSQYLDLLNEKLDLSGTGINFNELRDIVGVDEFCFFKMRNLRVFDESLSVDNFHTGTSGYTSLFDTNKKSRAPSTWCYVQKK